MSAFKSKQPWFMYIDGGRLHHCSDMIQGDLWVDPKSKAISSALFHADKVEVTFVTLSWRKKSTLHTLLCFPSSVIPSSFIIPAATQRSSNYTSRAAWQHLTIHTPCLHLSLFIKCQPLNFIRCMTLSNPICSHCRDFQLLLTQTRTLVSSLCLLRCSWNCINHISLYYPLCVCFLHHVYSVEYLCALLLIVRQQLKQWGNSFMLWLQ